jgi:hypothetical protein
LIKAEHRQNTGRTPAQGARLVRGHGNPLEAWTLPVSGFL